MQAWIPLATDHEHWPRLFRARPQRMRRSNLQIKRIAQQAILHKIKLDRRPLRDNRHARVPIRHNRLGSVAQPINPRPLGLHIPEPIAAEKDPRAAAKAGLARPPPPGRQLEDHDCQGGRGRGAGRGVGQGGGGGEGLRQGGC